MSEQYYIISDELKATRLETLVQSDFMRRYKHNIDKVALPEGVGGEDEIAVSPNGRLEPGVPYPSSTDSNTRFYLPTYRLNTDAAGLYTSRLKWRSADQDPNGPLAFLTVELIGDAPEVSGGLRLKVMPHLAVAYLNYRVPVRDAQTGQLVEGPELQPLEIGVLESVGGQVRRAQLPILTKSEFDRLYEAMTDSLYDCRLEIRCVATIGHRTWRQVVVGNIKDSIQLAALGREKALFTETLPSEIVREAAKPQVMMAVRHFQIEEQVIQPWKSRQLLETVGLLMTGNIGSAQPIDHLVAEGALMNNLSVIQPDEDALSEVIKASPKLLSEMSAASRIAANPTMGSMTRLNPNLLAAMKPAADSSSTQPRISGFAASPATVRPEGAGDPLTPLPHVGSVLLSRPELLRSVISSPPSPPIVVAQPIRPTPIPVQPSPSAVQPVPVALPALARAYAKPTRELLQVSDYSLRLTEAAAVKALPLRVLLQEDQQPVLVRTRVESRARIGFRFNVDVNAYMFDIPNELRPTTNHILLQDEVHDGSDVLVFYQDSAFRDQFYYQPQEFRLKRESSFPYLPGFKILYNDVVTQGEGNEATIHYRVLIQYVAMPYVKVGLLDKARQKINNPNARFAALSPRSTSLILRLPLDEASMNLTEVQRDDAIINLDGGIQDTIDLSQKQFEQLLTLLRDAGGLEGRLDATLIGNATAQIPVELSFKSTVGEVFTSTYHGKQPPANMHRVSLTNRVQTPVRLEELHSVPLENEAAAFPNTTPPADSIPPDGTFDVDYFVFPPTATVTQITPVVTASAEINLIQLISSLSVNPGYSENTFQVKVALELGFLGTAASPGEDPLTGVLVDFQPDVAILLDSEAEQAVTLPMPLLARIFNDPNAKAYQYRVTNLHGSDHKVGNQSEWIPVLGDAKLTIVPAEAGS